MYILCILSQLVSSVRSLHPVIRNRIPGRNNFSVTGDNFYQKSEHGERKKLQEKKKKKKKRKKERKKERKETQRQTEVMNYEVGSCFTRLIGTTILLSINTW